MSFLVGVVYLISLARFFVTPWTVALQAPLSMEFSRQEYRNGFPFSSPGYLPSPGIEPGSPAFLLQESPADSLPAELPEKPSLT